ncbi:AAA family ATPase [Bradyrhizobium sp. RT9b]|uniref:ATP-binding protein n=1 Tax=unclassified Bradyrhizobium TaxID=2631580 RepID=UPI0033984ADA
MPFGVRKRGPPGDDDRPALGTRGQPAARRQPRNRGIGALPTERKYLTIVRADLHRSTDLVVNLELEEAIDRLSPAMEQMRAAIHAYGGIIYRELGDGMFAMFGAPIADDLHAVMGCLAAIDMLQRIEALDDALMKVRVGVHSGQVVAGPRRLDLGSNYELDGLPLIMAERLQSVAEPGQALASATTRTLSDGYIRFGPAVPYSLKGFPAAVPLHVVEGIGALSKWGASATRSTARFVGRDSEAQQLLGLADRARGQGLCVAIVGEAGVGKSRLAREFVGILQSRQWQVNAAECSPILGGAPFSLLKAVFAETAAALGASALKQLQGSLPTAQSAALQVMLRTGSEVDHPEWTAVPPRGRSRAIVAATRALVELRAKAGPTVILLEDLQWADEASTAALQGVLSIAGQYPLLILATARSDGLPSWFADATAQTLRLSPLGEAGGLSMLDELLGQSLALSGLKQRILEHTGLMPLFIEEVCRRLEETGALRSERGVSTVAVELGVPVTVQGVIASRIDRLAPPAKRMLQVAAAIGPQVPAWLVRSVAALSETAFRHALAALSGAAMLVTASGPAHPATGDAVFAHELIRQVAYDAVTGPERIAIHGRILAELEAAEDDGASRLAAMAYHARMGQDWAKAADYAAKIARQSFAQSALIDATRNYETAVQALDRLPMSTAREGKAIDLRIEARLAYANIGKVSRWLDLAKEAEERSAAIGDDTRGVIASAVRAAALNFCGAPDDAREAGTQALARAERCANPGWVAYAEYGLGQACYVAGRYREAVDRLKRGHQGFAVEGATPPMGGSGTQAALLCCMMGVLCQVALGNETAAAAEQQLAEETAAREARPLATIAAAYSRGALLLHHGRLAEAEGALSEALALARRHEVNLFIPVIADARGLALLLLERRDDAIETLTLASAEADNLGHRSARLRADIYLALASALDTKAKSGALRAAQAVTQVARQQGYDPLELEALLLCSALHRQAGDTAHGTRCAEQAEEIAARTGAQGTLQDFTRYLGQLLEGSTGDHHAAR